MAKPTKNQELAQYFTYTYMKEANNRFAENLDSLIEEFENRKQKDLKRSSIKSQKNRCFHLFERKHEALVFIV